jgi:hypothetical protein
VVCEKAGIEDIGLAAGGTGKEGVDNARATAPSEQDGHVIGAGALDAVAQLRLVKLFGDGRNLAQDAERPGLGGEERGPLGGKLALFAADFLNATGKKLDPDDADLDESGMSVNADAVREDDLSEAGIGNG